MNRIFKPTWVNPSQESLHSMGLDDRIRTRIMRLPKAGGVASLVRAHSNPGLAPSSLPLLDVSASGPLGARPNPNAA